MPAYPSPINWCPLCPYYWLYPTVNPYVTLHLFLYLVKGRPETKVLRCVPKHTWIQCTCARAQVCSNDLYHVSVGLSRQRTRGSGKKKKKKTKAHSRLLKQVARSRLIKRSPLAGLGGTWITSDKRHGQEAEGKKAGDQRRNRRF